MKLDIGCGHRKSDGFTGLDIRELPGVDIVHDVRVVPWPLEADSVEEVVCNHMIEHLTGEERIGFFNELYRVMKPGAKARIVAPHWSHECGYGDPTHKWPPVSGWTFIYLHKGWRDQEAPHVPYTCDFDWQTAGTWDPWLESRNGETKLFAMGHYINSQRDIIGTLTKRA